MTTEKEKEYIETKIIPSKDYGEKQLNAEDINTLIEKYKDITPQATIIGKEPYEPFLAGIEEDTWMSVGDELNKD